MFIAQRLSEDLMRSPGEQAQSARPAAGIAVDENEDATVKTKIPCILLQGALTETLKGKHKKRPWGGTIP